MDSTTDKLIQQAQQLTSPRVSFMNSYQFETGSSQKAAHQKRERGIALMVAMFALLILTLMKPKFAVIPGAEGMEYLYRDWGMHLKNYLKGIVILAVFSLPLAVVSLVL